MPRRIERIEGVESPARGSKRGGRGSERGPHRTGSKEKKRREGPRPSDAGLDINDPIFQKVTKRGEYNPPASLKEVIIEGPAWQAQEKRKPRGGREDDGREPIARETNSDKLLRLRAKLSGARGIAQEAFGKEVIPDIDGKTAELERGLFNAYLSLDDGVDVRDTRYYPEESKKMIDRLVTDLRKKGLTDEKMGQVKLFAYEARREREEKKETRVKKKTLELRDTARLGRPDLGLSDEDAIKRTSDEALQLGMNKDVIKNLIEVGKLEGANLSADPKTRRAEAENFWYKHNLQELEEALRSNLAHMAMLRSEFPESRDLAGSVEDIHSIEEMSERIYGYHQRNPSFSEEGKRVTAQRATQDDLAEIRTRVFEEGEKETPSSKS